MAFKMNGWSAFKNKDDDAKKKEILKLRNEWIKGNKKTRDSIASLPHVGGDFVKYYKKTIKTIKSWPKLGEKKK